MTAAVSGMLYQLRAGVLGTCCIQQPQILEPPVVVAECGAEIWKGVTRAKQERSTSPCYEEAVTALLSHSVHLHGEVASCSLVPA